MLGCPPLVPREMNLGARTDIKDLASKIGLFVHNLWARGHHNVPGRCEEGGGADRFFCFFLLFRAMPWL